MDFSTWKKLLILRRFELPEKEKKSILLLPSALAIRRLARLVAGRVAVLRIVLLLARVAVGAVLCHRSSTFPLLVAVTTRIASVVVEGLTCFLL